MKYIFIIPEGIVDRPSESLSGKTPLESARIPNMTFFTKIGKVGTTHPVLDRTEFTFHAAFASLLGYEPKKYPVALGPLEAANLEIKLEENEVAFRMNFVTESEGRLADEKAGNLSTRESKALVNFLNKKLASDFVRFFPGRDYRHVAVLKDARGFQALSASCPPPQSFLGKPIQEHLPKGPGEDSITKLIYDSKLLLEEHEINQVRIDLGENPANMIWLWGQGNRPHLPAFSERFGGLSGASISTAEALKGFSRLIGLTVMELSSADLYLSFIYEQMAEALRDLIREKDFVLVHAPLFDETVRQPDIKQKVLLLESFDHHVVGAAKQCFESEKDVRVMIVPLPAASYSLKPPVRESVPFILAGKNIMPDELERFNESTAQLSSLRFRESWKLIDHLMSGKELVPRHSVS